MYLGHTLILKFINKILLRLLDQSVDWNIWSGDDAPTMVRQLRDSILSRDPQIEQDTINFLGLFGIINQLLFSIYNFVWWLLLSVPPFTTNDIISHPDLLHVCLVVSGVCAVGPRVGATASINSNMRERYELLGRRYRTTSVFDR